MQTVAVPLFNRNMEEEAYIFRDLKENLLFSKAQALNLFDGATYCETLGVLDKVGLDAFTLGKPVFVPISEINLMGNLPSQCREPAEKIIFVLEKPLSNFGLYFPLMEQLAAQGYRFGLNYSAPLVPDDPVMKLASFLFLSQRDEWAEKSQQALQYIKNRYRNLSPVAVHIYSREKLERLYDKGYALFESKVYSTTRSGAGVGPLKVNAIRLINTVQDENFDFDDVTKIIRGDPALTISLLKLVNASAHMRGKISSIQQAVARIGQREVRKWVTTAVSRTLGTGRPNEITRISLLRAKFAENLAPLMEMAHLAGELFLMGLFSVLDNILEMPMEEALEQVMVSDTVYAALVEGKGIYAPVIQFIRDYENASWSDISRQLIVHGIEEDALAEVYLNALLWYRDLVTE